MKQILFVVLVVSVASLINSCGEVKDKPGKGYIELSYKLNIPNDAGIEPSYQTTIWIENSEGKYIKSLLVSEYISYGGYSDLLMCLTWNNAVDWVNKEAEIVDAVTTATPDVGDNIFIFDCEKGKIPPGNYIIFVETHLEEEYNILLRGEISTEGEDTDGSLQVSYPRGKMEGAENALSGTYIKYFNSEISKY